MVHAEPETAPTASHALATVDHEEKGAAQEGHGDPEIKDLGWNEHVDQVPAPLVGGMSNEDLWVLVRRFDKQMYHVKAIPYPVDGDLDLNIADDEEFSPDKLRSNLERLYMTVILGLMGFGTHIVRLRSWKEARRTSAFCAVYFIAWALDFLVPIFFTTLIVLIVYPPSRNFLFPPAPMAMVDSKGGVKKPKAGVLGSHDTATGAPETHKGEAAEQEASNFVNSFASIALSSAAGKSHAGNDEEHSDAIDSAVPDPTTIATQAAVAKDSSASGAPTKKHDKTKQPMEQAMWEKMRPAMHMLSSISDGWERFANALSPTAPFPQNRYRLRLAALLVPAVCIGTIVTSYLFVKLSTFIFGVAFFTDPLLWNAAHWLNTNFPNWQKLLELRNTILRGVPTNAQLTLTLLRIGEANKAPLPPPPRSDQPPPTRATSQISADELPMDVDQKDVNAAIHPDRSQLHREAKADAEAAKKPKHGSRLLAFFKGTTKTTVQAALGADHLKADLGSVHAKNRLGVLPRPSEEKEQGPVDFKGRHRGKKGHLYVSTGNFAPGTDVPTVFFTSTEAKGPDDVKPVFSVPVAEIQEIKKVGGLGWKTKLVVGWAMDREVADGITIVDREGHSYTVTAIPLRDELFNRLVAMGGQRWVSW
ncbi:hypothetical protein L228DRAFT_214489 [Xylona heveae TC161]|uniref:Uncharacterized protein n=1 Tax=Xylona heveae (strain CBS 132557 / TC161) TaxID=1328760 RepID=A0A164ZY47_XYLHT|nr:hypothetical protein L228DRAFT_214489 [Xylona heveae TC161]KZF19687.1 hypothetical protein L228DRAFT_214489 [Xylona heveae TC161]